MGWKARKIRKVQEISPQIPILMSLLYHNDTIIKKEKELLRALLIQFCKLEFIWKILLSIHQEISFVHPYETNALHFS